MKNHSHLTKNMLQTQRKGLQIISQITTDVQGYSLKITQRYQEHINVDGSCKFHQ